MKKNQTNIILLLAFCFFGFSQIIQAQSDYKVEPPSFLFGAMKTDDAIKVDFKVVFANININ